MYKPRFTLMFSHLSVQVMFALWCIGWGIVAYTQSWHLLWLVPFGILAQMLNEYSVHRFIFHWPAPKNQFWFDVLYLAHYGHHDFPNKPALYFVPIWFAVPVALIHFTIAYGVFGWFGFATPIGAAAAFTFVGGITAFLFYEWFHMTAHTNVRKSWPERHVTRLHGLHHFRDFTRNYHVNPGGVVIDRVMGTAISEDQMKTQSRKEFLSTLGLAGNDPRLMAARARFAGRCDLSDQDIDKANRAG